MKKILVAGLCLIALHVQAQKTTPKKPVAKKPATPAVVKPLKNINDSVSYAIGMMVGNFYKQQGIQNLSSAMVSKAISDIYASKKPLLTEQEANMCLMSYMNPGLTKNLKEGESFLAANKKKTGVKTSPSGLQYEVIIEGKGPRPAITDSVTVNYKGTLLNGTPFDGNDGISFSLGGVIAGWTEALQLMPVGSKYKLYIPQQLAYGMNDNGPIPGGSVLVFEIELLGIKGK
ncbi:MAG: FKBP-type peptidyl-prolyl cis-trans isomerase [Flavisolibacter sp.]